MSTDNVNNPKHYNDHPSGVECITITEHMNFNVGNAVKYLWRAGLKQSPGKDQAAKHLEDLKKAAWYVNREIQRVETAAARLHVKTVIAGSLLPSIGLFEQTSAHDIAAQMDAEITAALGDIGSGAVRDPLSGYGPHAKMPELSGNEKRVHTKARAAADVLRSKATKRPAKKVVKRR